VPTNRLTLVLQHLRRTTLRKEGTEQTDAQLLEAFLRGRDDLALELLVRRHAPMVWGVCRRTLPYHEAEDAFQATFLVLVRKAASLRSPELLSHWLYRVACQTARKARQTVAKRGCREKQVRVMPEPAMEPHNHAFASELCDPLHEELSRLPEKYRIAVVLCDVQGRTRHEAAKQLRLPEGTVASRLMRGRALLARRLLRRGLSLSVTALAAVGSGQAASGAVPAILLAHTNKAVSLLAAGKAVTPGLLSPEVGPLAEGVLKVMAVAKQKTLAVWLVLAALLVAGGLATHQTLAALAPARATDTSPAPAARREGREWPSEPPGEVRRFPLEEWGWSVSFAPGGRQILIGVGGSGAPVRGYDFRSGREVLRSDPVPSCWGAAYSPDGKSIAVGCAYPAVGILDAGTGKLLRTLPANAGRIRNVVFSPDGRLIASSHADRQLRVWDVAQRRVLRAFPANNGAVHSAAFTPDGQLLLVIDPGTALRLYEVDSGKEVRRFQGHTARVTDVAISADGRRGLSCSDDGTLRLWDLTTGTELRCLAGHDGSLHGVAFCPDGRHAVSAGGDKTVRLWDLRTGRELHRFAGHQRSVVCVAVSPDGRYALSGSSDHTVRLWRLPDRRGRDVRDAER
jgi:RNA polymerase sigma factor (sigma-70 family)